MRAQTFSAPAEEQRSSMVFRPVPDRSRWEGVAVAGLVLIIDLVLLLWLARRPVDGGSFLLLSVVLLSLPLLLHLLYRTWGAFTLEYWIDRNAVRIRWAAHCLVVPLPAIRQVVSEGERPVQRSLRFWPGSFVRPLPSQDGVRWALFASRPPGDSLWLETDDALFAISPAQPDAFLAALQEHNQLGPSHQLALGRERIGLHLLTLLEDALGRRLLLAGMFGVLALFGVLFFAYPTLPDLLIFHYDRAGLPDSIRPKSALFLLPSIGLAAFVANSLAGLWMVYRQQIAGAYLVWGSTPVIQILSLLALFSLIR